MEIGFDPLLAVVPADDAVLQGIFLGRLVGIQT